MKTTIDRQRRPVRANFKLEVDEPEKKIRIIDEDLVNVLLVCESRIPADVHLYQLRIYFRDVSRMWTQLEFNILGRQFQKTAPDFTQGDLEQVWENHETTAGRA